MQRYLLPAVGACRGSSAWQGVNAMPTSPACFPTLLCPERSPGNLLQGKPSHLLNTSGGWMVRDLPYGFDALLENVLGEAPAVRLTGTDGL